jgi:PEP-CTERM motif
MDSFRPLIIRIASLLVAALFASPSLAAIPPFTPDAWSRGNDADTSYFGWDLLDIAGPPNFGGLYILDDSTPDLGAGITATGTRIYQGADGLGDTAPTANGHVSSSQNYYSFFDTSNDTITATAPASGSGGYTTVVLQIYENTGGDGIPDLQFAMDNSVDTWSLDKHLHNLTASGRAVHWVEWTAPGNDLTFHINMTSTEMHRVIDSFQVDTFWTAGEAPVVNAIAAVPEPASWLLALGGLSAVLAGRRKFGR